jgi:hypothetical protein
MIKLFCFFVMQHARDPVTGERRLDAISLAPFPRKYQVRLASTGSYHDARQLAKYVIAGGYRHPLSRKRFTERELVDIGRKIASHKLKEPYHEAKNVIICDLLNWSIVYDVCAIRAAAFVRNLRATCSPEMTIGHCIDVAFDETIVDMNAIAVVYTSMLRTTFSKGFAHVIQGVLASQHPGTKRGFLQLIRSNVPGGSPDPEISDARFLDIVDGLMVDMVLNNFEC